MFDSMPMPDCAICHAPDTLQCPCEAKELDSAILEAEARVMQPRYNEIRSWTRAHAQDFIFKYSQFLAEHRKEAYMAHLDQISDDTSHAPPHGNEIAKAQAKLKQSIDEDWQTSIQCYPKAIKYFYSLVEMKLPGDYEPAVTAPTLRLRNSPQSGERGDGATSANGDIKKNGKDVIGGEMARGVAFKDLLDHPVPPFPEGPNFDNGSVHNSSGGSSAGSV
ncbi:hypothetical protein G7Z17_g6851 [Cylindrodendrum hubeiense]|uniref:Uncharacterized protein n=1 Tax=Cylindrodendrum hubeiense TaxID=595255 RepID=A0A9P5HBK0_9HYPO|nr:hypothetical protein G7Z17_g6851 [Cylindrodendrum hubeiense]